MDNELSVFTVINTGEFHKIHDAFAAGVYARMQMFIQLKNSPANMNELIAKLREGRKLSMKKVLDAINYLIREEIKILGWNQSLVFIHELFPNGVDKQGL
jgi:hypothetical protein